MIDLHDWEERSAIREYCGGMTRFEAETETSKEFGVNRWEVRHAITRRDFKQAPDTGEQTAGDNANNLSEMLTHSQKQERQMPIGDVPTRRDSLEMLALQQ